MTQKEVIKNVLTEFLGNESYVDEDMNDSFLGLVLDEDEIDLLTNAVNEALERNNEDKT